MKNSNSKSKAARRKLEVPDPAAMPCKIPIKSSGETHRNIGKRKTRFVCVVDADENTRPRILGVVHISHQDHTTAKKDEFQDSQQSRSQIHSDASSNENSECKGSSGKIMSKIGVNSGIAANKSQK